MTRDTDPRHARRMLLQVTPLGFEVLQQGEAIFDELRDQWERQIGPAQLENLETHLTELVGDSARALRHTRLDVAGPRRADLAEPARPAPAASGDEGIPVQDPQARRVQMHDLLADMATGTRGKSGTQGDACDSEGPVVRAGNDCPPSRR